MSMRGRIVMIICCFDIALGIQFIWGDNPAMMMIWAIGFLSGALLFYILFYIVVHRRWRKLPDETPNWKNLWE